jgi:hypothetical protein
MKIQRYYGDSGSVTGNAGLHRKTRIPEMPSAEGEMMGPVYYLSERDSNYL